MILSCPSCQARYLVNPVQLGDAGRRVKCARCHHVWYEERPADGPVAPPPPQAADPSVETAPRPDLAAPRPEPAAAETPSPVSSHDPYPPVSGQLPSTVVLRRSRVPAAFWTLLVLLVGAVVAVGAVARGDMVRLYPPAIALYEAIGLPVDRSVLADHPQLQPALRIAELASAIDDAGALIVTGVVVNDADDSRRLVPLTVALLDTNGDTLASHPVDLGQNRLEARQNVDFEVAIDDWPDRAIEATVSLQE